MPSAFVVIKGLKRVGAKRPPISGAFLLVAVFF